MPNGIRAAIARGRRAEREDALSSRAQAFVLFVRIAEREGFKEAERIFSRIVRISRERLSPKASKPPRQRKRKGSRLFSTQLLGLWTAWKSQNPDPAAGPEEFARWWFKEWPHREYKKIIEARSLARRLTRELAKQA